MPDIVYETVGFCRVDEDGVPPGKVHDQLVGLFVELSVKLMVLFSHIFVADAVKFTVGTGPVLSQEMAAFQPCLVMLPSDVNRNVSAPEVLVLEAMTVLGLVVPWKGLPLNCGDAVLGPS